MGQVFFRSIACGLAGLAAWLVTEPFADRFIPADPNVPQAGSGQSWLIFLIGALVGLTAGALQGIARGSKRQAIENALLGFFFGAIGSTVGSGIGAQLASAIIHVPPGGIAHVKMPAQMVARALALFPVGLCMGVAIGATLRSKRGLLAGLMGGTVGGVFVGFGFDLIGRYVTDTLYKAGPTVTAPPGMMQEIGGPSRAILAVGLGVAVGLFVAVFDRVTRQAWVRLVLGRNEGKEWPIDNEKTMIGRDERAHVPLFGDPNVAPLHAIIFKQGSQYVVQDQGTAIGIGWNNQRVPNAVLSPGDTFQIGSHNLQFLMKDSAARAMHEGRAHAQPGGMGNAPQISQQMQPYASVARAQDPGAMAPGGMGSPGAPTYGQPQAPGGMGSPGAPTYGQPQGGIAGNARAASDARAASALVATSGPLAGQRFEVQGPLEAGREAAGIALTGDTNASRHHALFTPGPGGITVQDLGSTNGTFVNGQRVPTALLRPGDTVTIGNNSFRVE